MKKQLKKVIGTIAGAMAMTFVLTVPTYAKTSASEVTKVNKTVYLVSNNTMPKTISSDIITASSPWDNIIAADVSNYAHIRENGNTEAEIVGALYKGCAATIIEEGPEWSKITSGEVTGYIRNDLFVKAKDAKDKYEQTFEITDANPEQLEHVALTKVQWQEKLAEEKAKLEEERAKQRESQVVSAGSGELDLLAAIIQCEAGGESYEGKVAVGAVIMNRVNSGKFPDSITDVVYQKGQFSPVASGKLSRTLSSGARSDCYDAASDVLNGANNIGGCLYFNSGSGKGIQIGNQHFY